MLLPVQDPVAVGAEGDALLLGFANRGLQVAPLRGKFVDRLLAFLDDVMEVYDRRVLKPAMTAFLSSLVFVPQFPNAVFAF
jgi:hypothetical protein